MTMELEKTITNNTTQRTCTSLENLSLSKFPYMRDYIFVTYDTSKFIHSEDKFENSIGRKLLYIEHNFFKENSKYIYLGYIPLEMLGIKKREYNVKHHCIVYVDVSSLKQCYIDYPRYKNEKPNFLSDDEFHNRITIESNDVIGGEEEEEYIIDIVATTNLGKICDIIMKEGNGFYYYELHKTIALGPLIQLDECRVGIKVINYDLHVKKNKIHFLPIYENPDIYKKEKVEYINHMYEKYVWKEIPPNLCSYPTRIGK